MEERKFPPPPPPPPPNLQQAKAPEPAKVAPESENGQEKSPKKEKKPMSKEMKTALLICGAASSFALALTFAILLFVL